MEILGCDAPAVGAVLAVDDDEIDPLALADAREQFDDGAAAGFADDVAQEQEVEHAVSCQTISDSLTLNREGSKRPVVDQSTQLFVHERNVSLTPSCDKGGETPRPRILSLRLASRRAPLHAPVMTGGLEDHRRCLPALAGRRRRAKTSAPWATCRTTAGSTRSRRRSPARNSSAASKRSTPRTAAGSPSSAPTRRPPCCVRPACRSTTSTPCASPPTTPTASPCPPPSGVPAPPCRPRRHRRKENPSPGSASRSDPGHLGGRWARMEERWFRIGDSAPVMEGELTLQVARLVAERLLALGAERADLVRETTEPTTPLRPSDLVDQARFVLSERGVRNPPKLYDGPARPAAPQLPALERRGPLHARRHPCPRPARQRRPAARPRRLPALQRRGLGRPRRAHARPQEPSPPPR